MTLKDILTGCVISLAVLTVGIGCKKNTSPPSNSSKNDSTAFEDVWSIDTVTGGLIHYKYAYYYKPQGANQIVNVLKLDLNNPNYQLKFIALGKDTNDSLSSVAIKNRAIAGINGSFGRSNSFVKVSNQVIYSLRLPGGLRAYTNEGAFFYNSNNDLKIDYGLKQDYLQSSYLNIASGGPVLINDFKPVGIDFVGDVSEIDLDTLPYADGRRLMGLRNPRSAIALTKDHHLLFITIDGRSAEAAGMTGAEETKFIAKFFDPQYAINMDGGGSTTMYIKRSGPNGIVNYPTDNGKHDHYGQRNLYSFILIKEVD